MNKRALNRVFKQLSRVINIDNKVMIESDFFRHIHIHHSLTRDIVEQIASENPSWSEFDLYKAILEPVISQNVSNYNGLFIIYDLLARQASLEEKDEAYLLHQRAIYFVALRNLEGATGTGERKNYIHILGHSSCCDKCTNLHDKLYTAESFLKEQPIPMTNCSREDQLCRCFPHAITDGRFSRLINKGRLKP